MQFGRSRKARQFITFSGIQKQPKIDQKAIQERQFGKTFRQKLQKVIWPSKQQSANQGPSGKLTVKR
jgi:hypothetical protein